MGSAPGIESVTAPETMIGAVFADARPLGISETILLVEDEVFVREATMEVLESAGYHVVMAASATEALEAYRTCSGTVDLLLADVVMPGMSGRELAERFKTLCPGGRVLLMSGYADQLPLFKSSPHCNAYLGKPFSMTALLKGVREILDTNPLYSGLTA